MIEVLREDVRALNENIKELDDRIGYEFKQATDAHVRQGNKIRLDGEINVIAMAGLMITILVMVYQMATWTTGVNMKLDVMTGLMAQTAENTKDIKELRENELSLYSPKGGHDK